MFSNKKCFFSLSLWIFLCFILCGTGTAQTIPPDAASTNAPTPQQAGGATLPLTLEETIRLALSQASAFQQAQYDERIAAEDVRQAKESFLPRMAVPSSVIYTSPTFGAAATIPRSPSFIAANAVNEYQAMVAVTGDLDLAGRLRAALKKNRALLEAAHLGTEITRRTLVQAVEESYYALALATERKQAAQQNLASAQEFERITGLLLDGGEVAAVDLIRARLQTTTRHDEMEQALAAESAAVSSLKSFIGYGPDTPVVTTGLMKTDPVPDEVDRFTAAAIARRPELAQFEAERLAAEHEIKIARSERLPQLSYFIGTGFDTDTVRSSLLKDRMGTTASVSLTIPIFDWGASRSREKQAKLRLEKLGNERTVAQSAFTQQFYTARSQALTSANRIRLARRALTDAESNLTISITRYRGGEAQIIEVTDAQSTLAVTRNALSQAIFDYQIALSRLRVATGQ